MHTYSEFWLLFCAGALALSPLFAQRDVPDPYPAESLPMADWLRAFGPSPFSATLLSRISGRRTLDQRLLHGAKIELTGAK